MQRRGPCEHTPNGVCDGVISTNKGREGIAHSHVEARDPLGLTGVGAHGCVHSRARTLEFGQELPGRVLVGGDVLRKALFVWVGEKEKCVMNAMPAVSRGAGASKARVTWVMYQEKITRAYLQTRILTWA